MMKTLRIALSLLACVVLCLCLSPAGNAEGYIIDSGTCGKSGDSVTWTLYDNGKLVIEGTGAIANYGGAAPPWYNYSEKITSAVIGDGITSIGSGVFLDCIMIEKIEIDQMVSSIGDNAFEHCAKLISIVLPESVTNIGSGVFSGCSSLTSIIIPEGVTSIGGGAFDGCSSLTNITIPKKVTSIGWYAFQNCSSLTNITIPERVTSIGMYAFSGCSSLTSITIPESETWISDHAFFDCRNLTDVYYGGSEALWKTITIDDGNEILKNARIHYLPAPDFTLPASLTSIDSEAFAGGAFTYVLIPATATEIGPRAFAGCPQLRYVELLNPDTGIDLSAFEGDTDVTIIGASEETAAAFANVPGVSFRPAA